MGPSKPVGMQFQLLYIHVFILKKKLELTNATVADSSPRGKAAKFCQDSLFFRRLPHACRHSDKTSPPWARLATMIPFSMILGTPKAFLSSSRQRAVGANVAKEPVGTNNAKSYQTLSPETAELFYSF